MAGPGGADATLNYAVNVDGENGATAAFRNVADSMDDTDKSARKASVGMSALSDHLKKTKAEGERLRTEFNKTGEMGLLKDISKNDRDVKRLSSAMTSLSGATFDLGASAVSATGKLGPWGAALVGLIGVATLANAAVMAGGAAIAGLGAGVLAAGFKVRSGSAEMTDALNDLEKAAHDSLFSASAGVEKAFLPALGRLETGVRELEPELRALFRGPLDAVAPLTTGLLGLVDNALPGLQAASDASGDALKAIAEELPNLGATVSNFFEDISSGSDSGVEALMTLVSVMEISLNMMGKMIKGAEALWEWTSHIPGVQPLRDWIGSMAEAEGGATKLKRAGGMAAEGIDAEAEAAAGADAATRSLSQALGLVNFSAIDAAQAQIHATQETQRFAEAMKKSKGALEGNSEAALDNRNQALGLLQDYARTADNVTKLTGSVDKGTESFYQNVDALRASVPAGSAARAKIDSLIAGFALERGIALRAADGIGAINLEIGLLKDKKVKATAEGDASKVAAINAEIRRLTSKVVYLTVIRKYGGSAYGSADAAERAGSGRASGGSVMAGRPYMVGESGREMFVPAQSGTVITAKDTAKMASGGGGGGTVNVTINMAAGTDPDAVVRAIQKYAQRNNGLPLRGGVRTI
jgi:hypothetical protein